MGAGPGRPYRRSELSREPRNAWVFEGVAGDEFGDGGEICGAAAAYEFDRADANLGTPENADVLATATGFESLYYPVIEDFVGSTPEIADPGSPLVRADMVMMIGANGGGTFSVGSAAWCGSLTDADEQPTDAATITANVLTRFLDTPRGADPLAAGAA
jgi:N,N-dimethylformamidase